MEENLNIKEMVREEIHVTEAVGGETVPPAGTPEMAKQETKPKQQQRKELTSAEVQRRKKMLVYPLIFMCLPGRCGSYSLRHRQKKKIAYRKGSI